MVLKGETSHQVSSRCYRNGGDTLVPSHPGAKGSQMALDKSQWLLVLLSGVGLGLVWFGWGYRSNLFFAM